MKFPKINIGAVVNIVGAIIKAKGGVGQKVTDAVKLAELLTGKDVVDDAKLARAVADVKAADAALSAAVASLAEVVADVKAKRG